MDARNYCIVLIYTLEQIIFFLYQVVETISNHLLLL